MARRFSRRKCARRSMCLMHGVGLLQPTRLAVPQTPLAARVHRMHHAYADTPRDPHSPLYNKWWEILFSTWRIKNIPRKFVKDLYKNPRVMFFHKYRYYILGLTYVVLYQYLFYLIVTFTLSYIFYGMLNLFGHSDEGPINRWWINLFAPFEGNHNDHHTK